MYLNRDLPGFINCKFHILRQTHWSLFIAFFSRFWTYFFQIFDTACNTWHDATIACYFHTITHLIFSQCVNNSLRYCFYTMNKTRYCTVENVIDFCKVYTIWQYIVRHFAILCLFLCYINKSVEACRVMKGLRKFTINDKNRADKPIVNNDKDS